jgi:hypothetical protein
MQTQPHNKQSQVSQGQVEPPQQKPTLWNELFLDIPPVVTWFAIRQMIIFGIIFTWALCQVDFVMTYPQAHIKMDNYMELAQGIQTAQGNSQDHMLRLEKTNYGQKHARHVWNLFLVDKLMAIGFALSLLDDCVFFCDDIINMVYMDDGIFLGNNGL